MKFAKTIFWIAGIWGLLTLTPLFFMFEVIGRKLTADVDIKRTSFPLPPNLTLSSETLLHEIAADARFYRSIHGLYRFAKCRIPNIRKRDAVALQELDVVVFFLAHGAPPIECNRSPFFFDDFLKGGG